MKQVVLCMVVMALCAPAWAINKCTGADGKVAFQDAPCATGRTEHVVVRPARGDADAGDNAAASGADNWRLKAAAADKRIAIQTAVERHEPMIGMTYAQLELAMGLPNRINTGQYKSGSTQQRIYERGHMTWYVYTDEALVTAVQTSMSPGMARQSALPCPSAVEIRAAETSASSITLSDAERVERLRQIGEMRRCGR